MEIFGNRVKNELKIQGKMQIDLANHLGIKKTTLCMWLSGKNEPPMKTIVEIALFLNVSTDYLLGLEN